MIRFAQICYQKFDIFSLFLVSLTSLCQSCLAIYKILYQQSIYGKVPSKSRMCFDSGCY